MDFAAEIAAALAEFQPRIVDRVYFRKTVTASETEVDIVEVPEGRMFVLTHVNSGIGGTVEIRLNDEILYDLLASVPVRSEETLTLNYVNTDSSYDFWGYWTDAEEKEK